MKTIFLFLFLFITYAGSGQFYCIHNPLILKHFSVLPNANNYAPNVNTPVKVVRINFHFMLHNIGHPDYPGNFTETDDGNGHSNYNGYMYVADLMYYVNTRLAGENQQMNLPPSNTTSVLPTKYQFIVDAIYFHRDDNLYTYGTSPLNTYGENISEVINVFFQEDTIVDDLSGNAGGMDVYMRNCWSNYILNYPGNVDTHIWVKAFTIIHETGHNFGLHHTYLTSGGLCDSLVTENDYCLDTPDWLQMDTIYGVNLCNCAWNDASSNPNCSNNVMDYDGNISFTPWQLGRIHYTLQTDMLNYVIGNYGTYTLDVCNPGWPRILHVAEYITSPGSGCSTAIVPDGQQAVFIYNTEVVLQPGFEVEAGANFETRHE